MTNNPFYIICIPDLIKTIPDQRITYARWVDVVKNGKTYKNPELVTEERDIEINCFDGFGICTFKTAEKIRNMIGIEDETYSFMLRAPFMKGMLHAVDFPAFAAEHDVYTITDSWGMVHDINDVDIVITESMFKGKAYFKDWDDYWAKFDKYEHVMGISKWAVPDEDIQEYTRASYQILQDLDLEPTEFLKLADYTKLHIKTIVGGDIEKTLCYLGLVYQKSNHNTLIRPEASSVYGEAILKNPYVLQDPAVQKHIHGLMRKQIKEAKCGKLWVKGAFQLAVGDIIAFMEHMLGLEVHGCLAANECYVPQHIGENDEK